MALSPFQHIFHSLDQFELLRVRICFELQQLQSEHEGLLEQLGHRRQNEEELDAAVHREAMTTDSTSAAICSVGIEACRLELLAGKTLAPIPMVSGTRAAHAQHSESGLHWSSEKRQGLAPQVPSVTSISYPYFDGPRATAQLIGRPNLGSEATFQELSWYQDVEEHVPNVEVTASSLDRAVDDTDQKVLVLDEEEHSPPNERGPPEGSARSDLKPFEFTRQESMAADDLSMPDYKVEMFYYETGIAQTIARSEHFQNVTLLVIIANAIYIGIDADRNTSDSISEAHVSFQVCEYWFFTYFSLEWITRLAAFERKCNCMRDTWFKFDTFLVFMMVFENTFLPIIMDGAGIPIPTSMIKLVRLLRLARMARLMRALPELVAMIKGVRMSLRAVGSALLLLVILVYVFAIIVFVLIRDRIHDLEDSNGKLFAKTYFGTLSLTMWTLLVDGAFMDSYGSLSRKLIYSDQWLVFCALIVFVFASALTVMNMLIGVLCEVVTGVAAAEKEDADIKLVKETVLLMLLELDVTGDGKISREEMAGVMENDMALKVLKSLEVNASILMEQGKMLFEDSLDGNLTISEIVDLILMLRGERFPTVKDILHVQKYQIWKLMTALRQHEQLFITKGLLQGPHE